MKIKIFLFISLFCIFGAVSFVHAETAETSVNITLKIYSGDTVLFDGPKTITACAPSPEIDDLVTLNSKCAIEQSGLSNAWIWYDFDGDGKKTDGFLNELGGNSSDSVNNFYWGWFSNLNYGATSINSHILSLGEELLLTYNSYPLRIFSSKISGTVGDTITFTVEEKSTFNADWSDMPWTPSRGTTVTLGVQSCTTIDDGTCSIVLNSDGSLKAIGSKSLHVPSTSIEIEVSAGATNNGGGGAVGGSMLPPSFSVSNALSFLKNAQSADGSFSESDMYTDWAAIAYGALNVTDSSRDLLLNYFSSRAVSSLLTDIERRSMALLALGQNPYVFHGVDYVTPIVSSFDGTQFGDSLLINDDIFALILLLSAGYTKDDDIITKDIKFILSKQLTGGSWEESIDLTSAAIQTLKPFDSVSGISDILKKAGIYIANKQENNGGWGNIYSTSWAMQAAFALGVSWTKSGHSGSDYLATQQSGDGSAIDSSETLQNKIWATSYAIPAALGKSWSTILHPVSKPISPSASISPNLLPVANNTIVVVPIEKKITQKIPPPMALVQETPIVLAATAEKSGTQVPIFVIIVAISLAGGITLLRFVRPPK